MCHFITMVAPAGADLDWIARALKPFQRRPEVIENRFVQQHLRSGEVYFLAAPKFCDCGTALGKAYEDPADEKAAQARHQKDVAALRRKGWSPAKIERWEHDQAKAADRHVPHEDPDGPDEWPALIRSLLGKKELPYVGILLHMYNGGFETAPKTITRQRFPLAEDLGHRLYTMKEDVLYIVER